jgi:hypothetical protein
VGGSGRPRTIATKETHPLSGLEALRLPLGVCMLSAPRAEGTAAAFAPLFHDGWQRRTERWEMRNKQCWYDLKRLSCNQSPSICNGSTQLQSSTIMAPIEVLSSACQAASWPRLQITLDAKHTCVASAIQGCLISVSRRY